MSAFTTQSCATCLTNVLRKCFAPSHCARICHGTVQRFVILNERSAVSSAPTGLRNLRYTEKIYQEQCQKYTTLLNQCKDQYYKSKFESVDQVQLFRLIDGILKVKPVPPLSSHTERFSEHFINKITNVRENLASQAEINTQSCTSFFF